MINIGVIGCSSIAACRHIPNILRCKDTNLAAVYNRSPGRAEEYSKRYGCKAYTDMDAFLADPEIDAVIVTTITNTHCEYTVKALNAGKHVLCEKPMALSVEDTEKMIEAAEKSGRKLMISHNQRFYHHHRVMKELIDSGAIGKVLTFRTMLGNTGPEYSSLDRTMNNWSFKPEGKFGVIGEVGSHRADLICWIFGEPKKVFAHRMTLDKRYPDGSMIDLEDNVFALVEFESGVTGSFTTSWTSYSNDDRVTQVFGTEGVITTYAKVADVLLEKRNGEKCSYAVEHMELNNNGVILTNILEKFVECIVNDTEPFIPGKDGRRCIKLLEKMVESSEKGAWVDFN